MIRHVVMWKLKRADDAPRFKELLDSCRDLVPGMLEFDVGIRREGLEANVDVVLVSGFADAASLDAYLHHPHHKAVSAQLGPMRDTRSVLDFTQPATAGD
ncbi:MAG TPA: Dabb family protein [Albitalea sp.]|nr:Dabb family protein [Albitalea sp.]